jgi:hypothetical protein
MKKCKKRVFLHDILQAICFKMPVKCLKSCQTVVWQKIAYLSILFLLFLYYCTGNKKNACEKYELLSNNYSTKKKRISRGTGNMLQNACKKFQKIIWQKKRISPIYCAGNVLQNACEKFEFWSNNCLKK